MDTCYQSPCVSAPYRQLPSGLWVPRDLVPPQRLTLSHLGAYCRRLRAQGRARGTVEKYARDIRSFLLFLGDRYPSLYRVREWAQSLLSGKRTATVNGALAALNGFFKWLGRTDCIASYYKVQEPAYREDSRNLTEPEYRRLLHAADRRTRALLLTLRQTGVRVSELSFFTLEAVRKSRITVRNKGKTREVFLDEATRSALLSYCRQAGIAAGPIFRNRQGVPLSRIAVWQLLKRAARQAGVPQTKVFPHNLRHLFAVERYKADPDIEALRLDLGHSLVTTTQRYLKQTAAEHFARIRRLSAQKNPAR